LRPDGDSLSSCQARILPQRSRNETEAHRARGGRHRLVRSAATHRTWTRLEARSSKRRAIITVAAARELAGYVWAITQIE
jgi:hypothetical protein